SATAPSAPRATLLHGGHCCYKCYTATRVVLLLQVLHCYTGGHCCYTATRAVLLLQVLHCYNRCYTCYTATMGVSPMAIKKRRRLVATPRESW
ncbi:MAG: hypothetical protein K2H61_05600, partial [Muribaculaceae bacterium]|nr:hypothetical protein [Muribaculaceae bacterium]